MITFQPLKTTTARVFLNGSPTKYTVSKPGTFYEIHWDGHPLPASYCSKDKSDIKEGLQAIAHKNCVPRPFDPLHYIPA